MAKNIKQKPPKQKVLFDRRKKREQIVVGLLVLFLLGFTTVWLKTGFNQKQVLGIKNTDSDQQSVISNQELIAGWEKIVTDHPDYRDGWIRLSVICHEAGYTDKAKEALEKAKELDPNNETIKSLENIIQ